MKIQMKYPALACCVMMLTAGCSQTEAISSSYADENNTRVPLTIASAELQTEVTTTRAFTALGTGASIGVVLGNVIEGKFETTHSNVRYNYGSTKWIPESELVRIYVTSPDAYVCAYYPYNAAANDAPKVSLVPCVLADGEAPLAYATIQNTNAGHKEMSFSMTQACSWLVIDFKRGNTKDDITLSEFSLTNSGLYKESVLNITDGSSAGNTVADGGTLTFTGDIALPKNSTATRNISMPPSPTLTGGVKVSVKVKEYGNKVLSTTLTGLTALARGYKYALTITVDGDGLGVSSVEILPWTESTVNNGGSPWIPLA